MDMNKYTQALGDNTETHFSSAVVGENTSSKFITDPTVLTTFNAGDIVPLYCMEVLPHDTLECDLSFVVRQTTTQVPSMANMLIDYYAFFVPNRVVNKSWKSVMGENPNGSWTATEISLAPLVDTSKMSKSSFQVPVGSVADYYGFPTQSPLPADLLASVHDLKFRGYIEIYNEFFRDQNYQPPIAYSKLNVFENFFHGESGDIENININSSSTGSSLVQDNSYGNGAVAQALLGNLKSAYLSPNSYVASSAFNALGAPLKANKLHDYFTSVLPSTQKAGSVLVPFSGSVPVGTSTSINDSKYFTNPLQLKMIGNTTISRAAYLTIFNNSSNPEFSGSGKGQLKTHLPTENITGTSEMIDTAPTNLVADMSAGLNLTLDDIRLSAALQQTYEALARSGSRYREYIRGFFNLEVDDPYKDIPSFLGHFRRDLDLYQTAQTAASADGSTPQGNLAAFGYTANGGKLFPATTFLEHGYIHILGVVRHRNVYSSFLAKDNFRRNFLDFYQPTLANISEQPVYTREINPYASNSSQVFGYQEAWAEYRYDPSFVTGQMRPGVNKSLSIWNYADDFNSDLTIATGDWLKSNSAEVLDRSLAISKSEAPQLKGQFVFHFTKERMMPLYSLPGLDIF